MRCTGKVPKSYFCMIKFFVKFAKEKSVETFLKKSHFQVIKMHVFSKTSYLKKVETDNNKSKHLSHL